MKGTEEFEIWLRKVCFQKPTPEAYDLAKDAWVEALKDKPSQPDGELKYAKYEIKRGVITKDGHTMFLKDIVKDLNRKSFLEKERNQRA